MTWVVATRGVHFRRPRRNQSFAIQASARPQLVVHDFADFIVAQRAGHVVPSPGRGTAPTGPGGIAQAIQRRD